MASSPEKVRNSPLPLENRVSSAEYCFDSTSLRLQFLDYIT